ncbi:hypothetical protein BGZ63DRAFT_407743 [Mariannaea sp. PMI_226]|nr:hypothetical protein BGZ63DRAFT_407743 [Mariannaea sp. PMI_226]
MSHGTTPSAEDVAELQRTYTGLDNNLNYIPGHTIDAKYQGYKAAHEAAKAAATTYKTTSDGLKVTKPYAEPAKPVGGKMFYQAGHQTLAPIAGDASTAAQYHCDRRTSFNTTYKPVLDAKNEYAGHVQQATLAQQAATKYAGYQTKHQQFS